MTACKSNLKNIGTAVEMYSVDHDGAYPQKIDLLTPNYLKTFPECPSAGEVTYLYGRAVRPNYEKTESYDSYLIYCRGEHHKSVNVPKDYPKYDGVQGLIER